MTIQEESTQKAQQTIERIYEIIRWLDSNGSSQAITHIVLKLDQLAIEAMWFSDSVSQAYGERNNAEEDYKHACAKSVSEAKESATKAIEMAKVEFAPLKREFLAWDALYHRLKLKMDRIDVIIDTQRQRVSLLKQMDLKNVGGGI